MAFLPADILERLRRSRELGRLPHAMLITGTPGSGRVQLAMQIAAMVNDTTVDAVSSHPDIHTIEPESKSRRIVVEAFKEFCVQFFSTSFKPGATKTGIVIDADRLHVNAANAFLKTLEEPPPNCLFILITTNPGLLPVTIVSRCAHFPLRSAEPQGLDDASMEIGASTGELLGTASKHRTGAALRLARHLQTLLREARAATEDELTASFKAEKKRLGDNADDEWLKDEEARIKALIEARTVAMRHRLVGIIGERVADVLRARHGVSSLHFPAFANESRQLAESLDDASLLRVLDGAAQLRVFLDRNVKEDIALEAGCLSLIRS